MLGVRNGVALRNAGDTVISGGSTITGTTDTSGFWLQQFGPSNTGAWFCRWHIGNTATYTRSSF